jgi:hypothetical protein
MRRTSRLRPSSSASRKRVQGVAQDHALKQRRERLIVQARPGFDAVEFLDAVLRSADPLGKLRVVGQEQQPAGLAVESAHGADPFRPFAQPVVDGGTGLGIRAGGDQSARLVKGEIERLRALQRLAVEGQPGRIEVEPQARIARHPAVKGDAPREDPRARLPARTGAALRENALQLVALHASGPPPLCGRSRSREARPIQPL